MNVGVITCLILAVFFSILSIMFALLKEKSAIFISGFNSLSKDERDKYDKNKISLDMRNSLFIWAIILFIGAILSYFISKYCSIIAIAIWLIIFFKNVDINPEKVFNKYKN